MGAITTQTRCLRSSPSSSSSSTSICCYSSHDKPSSPSHFIVFLSRKNHVISDHILYLRKCNIFLRGDFQIKYQSLRLDSCSRRQRKRAGECGNVTLHEIDGLVVVLKLEGACGSCLSSTITLKMGQC